MSHGLLNTGAINAEVRHPASPGCHLTGFGDIMMTKDEKPPSVDLMVATPVTAGELREAVAQVWAAHDRYWRDDRPAEVRTV